jgi:hypothetical protein
MIRLSASSACHQPKLTLMSNRIFEKDVRKQLKADLIGKDSYRGVTLTYSWMANQFGHISLGFIPTYLLFLVLSKFNVSPGLVVYSPVIIWGAWIAFESYNFLGPLLSQKQTKSKLVFVKHQEYTFAPDWWNVAYDTATDLGFFGLGAFAAGLLCNYYFPFLIVWIIIILLLLYSSRHWFLTKIYLQAAEYPFQFRLSQWDLPIEEADKKTIQQFLSKENSACHLLIFGTMNSGKTSLGVGIATEHSIRHKACVYTTAVKLFSLFFMPDDAATKLWTWRNSDVLVIDDVNPGRPITREIIDAASFLQFIDTNSELNDANRKNLCGQKVIWVSGTPDAGENAVQNWQNLLLKIGVPKEKILTVVLP